MRIVATSDGKHVEIHIKGKSVAKLRAAEETARQLLDATPEPDEKPRIGFTATSDTERADD